MSQRRLGITVGRRGLCAAGLERTGREFALCARWQTARAAGESMTIALERLLSSIPDGWRDGEIHVALSPVDLACADILEVPYRNENQLTRVAPSLAEGRCAGETVEELAIDVLMMSRVGDGALIQLAAFRSAKLKELNDLLERLLPKATVGLVTTIPFSLLRAVPEGDGLWGVPLGASGEGAVWERKGGEVRSLRVFPMEGSLNPAPSPRVRAAHVGPLPQGERVLPAQPQGEEGWALLEMNAHGLNSSSHELHLLDGPTAVRGLKGEAVVPGELAAVGAALLDPDRSINLLRAAPGAPRSVTEHLRAPLLASAVAATVLFVATGLYFDLCARQYERDLARCGEKEQAAWKAVLPSESYQPGTLAGRLQRETQKVQHLRAANDQASALRLWGELSSVMPKADQVGLTLEEIHLTRRGGRLQAKVPAAEGNPLQNASLIESSINRSTAVAARGEFEQRDKQITVRMQLDYKPQPGQPRAP